MRYRKVSIPELGIEIRYRKVSIPGTGIEIGYRKQGLREGDEGDAEHRAPTV